MVKKNNICESCEETFQNKSALRMHKITCEGDKQEAGEYMAKAQVEVLIEEHLEAMMEQLKEAGIFSKEKTTETKEIRCPECETIFKSKDDLEFKEKDSKFEEGYYCTECPKGFFSTNIMLLDSNGKANIKNKDDGWDFMDWMDEKEIKEE